MQRVKTFMTGWFAAIALALFAISLPAHAQLAVGRDYTVIEPAQGTDDPGRIEVVEFFSYACSHCNEFHPHVSKWAAKLPSDVTFKRVPVSFNRPQWANLARLYYALEATGDLAKLDGEVFHALHDKGLRLIDDDSIQEWAVSQGVDAKKFSDAYNSFGVVSKTKRADQMAQNFRIRGVPALAVDGRYLVVGQSVKSTAELLPLTDKIIDKVRAERKLKK